MRNVYFFIFILFLNQLFCQTSNMVEAIDGMPQFVSENLKTKFDTSYYYILNGKPFFEHLVLVHKGIEKKTTDNFWLIKKIVNNPGYSFSTISFEKDSPNGFFCKGKLINSTEDELSPLLLNFDDDFNLSYSWANGMSIRIIKEYPYKIGKTLPNILLKNQIDQVYLNSLKGKIVVINWWATNCAPCIAEIPGLNKLVEKYDDIEFVSIVNDKKNLEAFLKKHEFNYKNYLGDEDILGILGDAFPRNIILNRIGTIVYNKLGASKNSYKDIEKVILTLK